MKKPFPSERKCEAIGEQNVEGLKGHEAAQNELVILSKS